MGQETSLAEGQENKKIVWTYDFQFNPSLAGPNSKYKSMRLEEHYKWGMSRDITAMNHMHTLSAESVVSRKVSAGGGVVIYRTKAVVSQAVNVPTDSGHVELQPHDEWSEYTKAKIPVTGLNAYVKRFYKRSSAPFGMYNKYELFARVYQTIYKVDDFISRDSSLAANVGRGGNFNFGMGLGYSFGNQLVLKKDKLALDYGVRLAYFFGMMKRTGRLNNDGQFDPMCESEYIKSISVERLFRFELLNFKVGMSFLK
jgi:hypothetical protein